VSSAEPRCNGNVSLAENVTFPEDLEFRRYKFQVQISSTCNKRTYQQWNKVSVPYVFVMGRFLRNLPWVYCPLASISCLGLQSVHHKRWTGCNSLFQTGTLRCRPLAREKHAIHFVWHHRWQLSSFIRIFYLTVLLSPSLSVAVRMSHKDVVFFLLHFCREICCLKRN
jgi:hypothetical protein